MIYASINLVPIKQDSLFDAPEEIRLRNKSMVNSKN